MKACNIMKEIKSLADLNPSDVAQVTTLNLKGAIRRRLKDIGLIEGTRVECVLKSPLGDPSAYRVRGAVVAIRKEDAEKILVEVLGNE